MSKLAAPCIAKRIAVLVICVYLPAALRADYKDDVGYTALVARMGGAAPTGAGILVSQIEAPQSTFIDYLANSADPEFAGKTITDVTTGGVPSPHATLVGKYFFGNLGIGKGITQIRAYEVDNWFYNALNLESAAPPIVETARVQNHSYAGYYGSPVDPLNVEALRRLDLAIDRDGFTAVVGAGNGHVSHVGVPIHAQLTNGIVVGLTNGNATFGLTNVDGAGRVKPDMVAPSNFTSNAAPMVAASAALLHEVAGSNAAARRPETIKAILMAGATKTEFPGWARQNAEPLDRTFGAGELNIDNSVKIMQAGRQASANAAIPAHVKIVGWDYAKIDAGDKNYYFFETDGMATGGELSVIAAWNRRIGFNAGVLTPSMANIDLKLYAADENFHLLTALQQSASLVDNVEHIYMKDLAFGWYALEVSSDLAWTYGLAWNYTAGPTLMATPEPAVVLSFLAGAAILFAQVQARRRGKDTVDLPQQAT